MNRTTSIVIAGILAAGLMVVANSGSVWAASGSATAPGGSTSLSGNNVAVSAGASFTASGAGGSSSSGPHPPSVFAAAGSSTHCQGTAINLGFLCVGNR